MAEINNEKISIIVPAYNIENYIGKCLESLVNQTYKNIEIIVVNDGSKDNTLNIINEYADKDKRIKVINQENQGVSASRNNALKQVESEYIMFVDSDDWLELNSCEEILKVSKEENADIVMFGYIREYEKASLPKAIYENEKIVFEGNEIKKLHRRLFGPIETELANPEKLNVSTTVWGKLYKSRLIKDLNFTNLNELGICEDGYFNISVFERAKKIVFTKKYFYHYRKIINSGSLTQKRNSKVYQKNKLFHSKLKEMVCMKNLPDEYNTAIYNRLALSLIEMVLL